MFSHFFIDRPIFATVVCLVIVMLGIVSFPMLPVEQFPDVVPPSVYIQAMYPGASAIDVINAVAVPLEEALNGVDHMIYMETTATSNGTLQIVVTFATGTDPDIATVLVQNRVKQAEMLLPEEVRRLGVSIIKRPGNFICILALSERFDENTPPGGTKSGQYLANYASLYLRDRLLRVAGIGDVMMFDRRQFSMRIWLDADIMAARGLSVQEVHAAIRAQNTQVSAGRLGLPPIPDGLRTNPAIVTLGRLDDAEQFENIILRVDSEGRTLRLRDVAMIELGSADYTSESRIDGRMSTAMAIVPQPGANSLEVSRGVIELMESLEDSLTRSGLEYSIAYNATNFIQATVNEFWETIILCTIFVAFVIFLFLQDWRAALIPILMIPICIIGTFFIMWCIGFSINTMSLFGLIVVIGIVVDNAIIVVENTQRIIDEEGLDSVTAAKKSMLQVMGPVISSTLIILAVFLPTAMMMGIVGMLYQQFALTISGAVALSGITAVTFAPALCAILLRPSVPNKKKFILFRAFNFLYDGFIVFYLATVKVFIYIAPIILILWFVLIVGLADRYGKIPKGFIPAEDVGVLMMEVRLPEGASMERTGEILALVESIISVERGDELGNPVYSDEYHERGFFRRLYDRFWNKKHTYVESGGVRAVTSINGMSFLGGGQASNIGMVLLPLHTWEDRRRADGFSIPFIMPAPMDEGLRNTAIQARIRERLSGIPEAEFLIVSPPPINIGGMASGVAYVLLDERGVGPNVLAAVRDDLMQQAVAPDPTDPSAIIVHMLSPLRPNSPQLFLDIDRDKAMQMGINLAEVFATLQSLMGVAYVNDFNLLGRTFRVNMQAKGTFRDTEENMMRIHVRNRRGEMVPLSAFATLEPHSGPQLLTRYNMFPSASMTGIIRPDRSTGEGIQMMEELSRHLPDGFTYDWTGLTFEEKRTGNQMVIFFFISILFCFLILAAQYESWASPLIIMMAVPLGVCGAFIAVIAFAIYGGFMPEINVYTQIGLLVIIGFSAKNAVLIVEFARTNRAQGAGLVEAAYEAGRVRVRPIFITAFASILGFLPLIWADGAGSNARNALGNSIFGGLLTETMVGIYVTPVLFVIIQGMSEWFNRQIRGVLGKER